MRRISIDVTPEQHQKLKALAALQGKSIKQFVLESTIGDRAGEDLAKLEAILDERLQEARGRSGSARAVGEIFRDAYRGQAGSR